MCIAILNTKNRLSRQTLENSWNNNDQGAGLLWNQSGHLQTFKTYKLKELKRTYNKLRDNPNIGKIVLHFRIATSGYEKYTNLHPFLVNPSLGFVHNGVITGLGNNQHSDTYQFNELLKSLPSNFLSCQGTRELIRSYIGYSKLIFLDNQDTHTIINEKSGEWIEDNWFSNDSHSCYLDYQYHGNTKVSRKASKGLTTYFDTYDTYDTYQDEYTPTKNVRQQNIDYLDDFWSAPDEYTRTRFLNLIGKSLDDPELWVTMEELNQYYNVTDLNKLTWILKNEETNHPK